MSSSSEPSTSLKAPSSLSYYSSLSVILEASKGLWRQHMHDENTRWAARFQETKYTGLELKHHKKGVYRKFPLYS